MTTTRIGRFVTAALPLLWSSFEAVSVLTEAIPLPLATMRPIASLISTAGVILASGASASAATGCRSCRCCCSGGRHGISVASSSSFSCGGASGSGGPGCDDIAIARVFVAVAACITTSLAFAHGEFGAVILCSAPMLVRYKSLVEG